MNINKPLSYFLFVTLLIIVIVNSEDAQNPKVGEIKQLSFQDRMLLEKMAIDLSKQHIKHEKSTNIFGVLFQRSSFF